MSERSERIFAERSERRSQERELVQNGFKSTGDLPYVFAHKHSKLSSNALTSCMSDIVKFAMKKQDQEYCKANAVKIGIKTFLSPDLQEKVEDEVKKYFNLK